MVTPGETVVGVRFGSASGLGPTTTYDLGAASYPTSILLTDVNGDFVPDLVVADAGARALDGATTKTSPEPSVKVRLGLPSGTFGMLIRSALGGGLAPRKIAVGDVNGDKFPDYVTANAGTHDVTIAQGRGGGGFAESAPGLQRVDLNVDHGPSDVALADLDGDTVQRAS